jgi:hypothetical protein
MNGMERFVRTVTGEFAYINIVKADHWFIALFFELNKSK